MIEHTILTRREAIAVGCGGLAAALVGGCSSRGDERKPNSRPAKDPTSIPEHEVTANEDLMREHGVLGRIMLIYEFSAGRLAAGQSLPAGLLKGQAELVRDFVEDYHESNEEIHVFPVLRKAGQTDLANLLLTQHLAGRALTDTILSTCGENCPDAARQQTIDCLRQFIAMYRPHMYREDTVAFPAFADALSPADYDRIGDEMEDREHELFGEGGFERILAKVAAAEKALGIYDLAQFTPKG